MEIIDHINKIVDWNSDELFLRDAIVLSSAKLLKKCHQEVESGNIVTVAPLLRQVQENLLIITGLVEEVLTMEQFISDEHKPKDIMRAVRKNNPEINPNKFEFFNNYLLSIKEMLNKYSHTSFEGVMTLFTERFQVSEAKRFNRIIMNYVISLIEAPFIVMVNYIYDLDYDVPTVENVNRQLKELGSLRYISRSFPVSIRDYINNSEVLRNYYLNIVSDLKNTIKEYASLKPL